MGWGASGIDPVGKAVVTGAYAPAVREVRHVQAASPGLPLLCNSKNEPPAMQGEGRSLDKSMNSCARIKVGLQNHK